MASTQETFNFVIAAIDHATAPIRKIAEAVLGVGKAAEHAGGGVKHVGAAAAHAGHELHSAGNAAHKAAHQVGEVTAHNRGFMALVGHVHLLRHHFGELNVGIGEVGHSLTEFLPMLGALGAAGSLVGLFELTEHVAEMRSEFVATATKIGILPGQLGALSMAAKLTDVNVESMQGGLVKLDKAIATAASGKNKDAAGLFAHLGISLRDSAGHMKSVSDLMPALADAMKRTADPAMRVRMAMALFGKSGADMIPMLAGGSEALKEFADTAKEVNYAPSREEAEGLEEFHRGWIKLQSAATGFANAIGSKLAPVLAPVLELATEWVVANRDWVSTAIAAKVGELAGWLRALDLPSVIEATKEWVTSIVDLSSHVGGFTTIIGAATLAIGSPLLSGVRSVIEIVGVLGKSFMWLGSLLWANPILAAIGLVAVAAYEIYEHWDWVRTKMGEIFTWFSSQSGWVQALITIAAPIVGFPMLIIEHWEPIKDFFVKLWADIRSIFEAGIAYIQPILDRITGAADTFSHSFIGRHVLGAIGDAGGGGPAIPSPYADNSPAAPSIAGGGGQDGKVHVQVDINNLPPGSKATSSASGAAQTPDLNVGYAQPVFAY